VKNPPAHGRVSAGILLYRLTPELEVLIAHPGGPFWESRDDGAWSIPKGLVRPGEDLLAAARREFEEETGLHLPEAGFVPLGSVVQRGGKTVHAWGLEGDADADSLMSNTFSMQWPPGSGKRASFPELDRFAWASIAEAARLLNEAQTAFVFRLSADTSR
jgi:predicted NUDIX family NTP pyrophosphohydrolase